MSDSLLWRWFSRFIRLRDADDLGYCRCFTCGRIGHWKDMDCGHGVGRQHKATKYDEQNNHAQCKRCNGFEEGRKDVYSKRVDEIYGEGTWNKLLVKSRMTCKRSEKEIQYLAQYYKSKATSIAKRNGIKL